MSDLFDQPVLAFDTALNGCVMAVRSRGKTATRELETDRDQATKLIPLIQETLEEAGAAFADLGLIVTTVGPGSFTGLRIGLSTARSLSLALGIPVHGIGTLYAMAATCHQAGDTQRQLILLETKRRDFYVQSYDAALNPLREPGCASLTDILAFDTEDTIFSGDASLRFIGEASDAGHPVQGVARHRRLLDPMILLARGCMDYDVNGRPNKTPEPVYLRGADVSMSNKIQREIQDSPL